MGPEDRAREQIDRLLDRAGWKVQDLATVNLSAALGVAIREFPLRRGHGFADYLLYVDGKAAGVVEAKPEGATLTGVEPQAAKYSEGLPEGLPAHLHFTLKTNPLKRADLDDFVRCYHPENRHDRKPTWSEQNPPCRWRAFAYEELIQREKANLDISWLKDESLEESANLPDPNVIAAEIAEDLQSALDQFSQSVGDLGS